MKILIGHTHYIVPGGEDSSVTVEKSLLVEHGHHLLEYYRDNREIHSYSFLQNLRLFFSTSWSQAVYAEIYQLCIQKQPDIAHFHNTFPLLSPAVYYACRDAHVPVVQTLHNYRLICPGGLLLREGKNCELCLNHSVYKAVQYRCYRNSAVQTLAVSRMLAYHRNKNTWNTQVDRYIALTDFAKRVFVRGGLPMDKITIKPNFTMNPCTIEHTQERAGALYVGRLKPGKRYHTALGVLEICHPSPDHCW